MNHRSVRSKSLLALCAAGLLTTSAVLHAADDHQTKNAASLAKDGAAVLLPQSELTPERLATEVRALLHDDARRMAMAAAARRRGHPDAAAAIVDDLTAWLGGAQVAGNDDGAGGDTEPSTSHDEDAGDSTAEDADAREEARDADSATRTVQTATIPPALDQHAARRRKRSVRARLPAIVALGATGTWE